VWRREGTAKPISLFVALHSPPAPLPLSAVRDTSMASSAIQHDAVQIHHKTYVRALFIFDSFCATLFRDLSPAPRSTAAPSPPQPPPASGFWTYQFARGAVHVR
jgi:hypothetical protein